MVKAPVCGTGDRGFESHLPPHKLTSVQTHYRGSFFKTEYIGVSSSGKTQHFDCCIRRFESCHPSQKKTIAKEIVFFSYIRLTASYIGCTSYICFASDIGLRPVLRANIISLKPQVSISLSRRENITPSKTEYH